MGESLIYNINQLKMLLEEKYGERINIDSLYILMGSIKGMLDSKSFGITFEENQYLILTSNSRSILDVLTPFLIEVMGEKPICSYDLLMEEDIFPTIEWDVLAPEKRINDILNGKSFSDESKIINLKIYTNDLEKPLQRTLK